MTGSREPLTDAPASRWSDGRRDVAVLDDAGTFLADAVRCGARATAHTLQTGRATTGAVDLQILDEPPSPPPVGATLYAIRLPNAPLEVRMLTADGDTTLLWFDREWRS